MYIYIQKKSYFGVLGFWGFGVLGFWGFGVLGFWGFGVLGGFGVLALCFIGFITAIVVNLSFGVRYWYECWSYCYYTCCYGNQSS